MTSVALAQPTVRAPAQTHRLPFVDLLRAMGSQAIVWHHLAFYGPLSDIAYPLAPLAIDLLYDYARMAVQIFFVLGGFMTARITQRSKPLTWRATLRAVLQRYLRIGLPYIVTLVIAMLANSLAGRLMEHESISAPPTLAALGAHLLFLQSVLDHEAITAGIWYLAIDFQLFLLLLFVSVMATTLCRSLHLATSAFLAIKTTLWGIALASLFYINRNANLDDYALYFFGAYFGGVLVAWRNAKKLNRWELPLYLLATALAVGIEFRPRLLVAAATTCVLWFTSRTKLLERWPQGSLSSYLGRTSYSLFLIHFPVCLVVNAVVSSYNVGPEGALLGMVTAWAMSMAAAHVFYRFVETPSLGLRLPSRPPQPLRIRPEI